MDFASPLKEVKPLFSPTSLPRPGGIIEELWSSREVKFLSIIPLEHSLLILI
jgi:hypothetical protein